MLRYNLVVFDLDGTLLDTSGGIIESVKDTMTHFKRDIPNNECIRKFIGPPIQDAFQDYFGLSKDEADKMAAYFRNMYKDVHLFKAEPYPGIYDLLHSLRKLHISTVVATNKRIDYTRKLLEHYDMFSLFDSVCGSDYEQKLKKSDIIKKAINESGMFNSRAVMVGDSIGDYNGAKLCGLPFIGVTYGFGFGAHEKLFGLEEKVIMANSVQDLEHILCEDI